MSPETVQVHLLKLSGNDAACLDLPGTTLLAELQALAEAAVEHSGHVVIILDGRRLLELPGELQLDSVL